MTELIQCYLALPMHFPIFLSCLHLLHTWDQLAESQVLRVSSHSQSREWIIKYYLVTEIWQVLLNVEFYGLYLWKRIIYIFSSFDHLHEIILTVFICRGIAYNFSARIFWVFKLICKVQWNCTLSHFENLTVRFIFVARFCVLN